MSAPKKNCFNPMGRPKGAKSKKTKQWEYFAEYCMAEGLDKFTLEMNELKGKHYVQAYLHLMEYFKPKLSRIEGKIDCGTAREAELMKLLEDLLKTTLSRDDSGSHS